MNEKSIRAALRVLTWALAGALSCVGSAHATLLGDSITGHLTQGTNVGVPIISDFVSPAIVGPGIEFTSTTGVDVFGQTWVINVDVGSDNFLVSFSSNNGANISSLAGPYFTIELGNLDWNGGPGGITGVSLANVSGVPFWGDGHTGLSWMTDSISVAFNSLENGASYLFDVQGVRQVPEPGTLGLLGLGLAGLGFARRRKAA